MIQIKKNETQFFGIKEQIYKGHRLVDLRLYFRTRETPEGIPTQKGISIRMNHLPAVLWALEGFVGAQKKPTTVE
jgi:hypothetical protein